MKNDKWVQVYKTITTYRAEIVKQVLKSNDIKCISINKIDSSYNNFGYHEILVVKKNYLKAQKLIQEY
ncbi:MAG: hypothetical protein CL870_02825 [Cytophagia bacterium]|nr:hypothetical protein [Cytophagia bacterium]